MFIQSFLLIFLDCAENSRFYLNWVIFEKGWETLNFVNFFSISWLSSVPFDLFVFVLANCGNSHMYLGKIHSCSCIAHMLVLQVHIKCLIKCPIVLDSNEFQTLGITMIGLVYHVLIIKCVFYTLWPKCA